MLALASQKVRLAVVGLVATTLAFFLFRGSGGREAMDPIDAVPKDSFLVGSVDMAELRRSPIYEVLFGRSGGAGTKAIGLDGLEAACGFDPFSRVGRLAIAVPEKEGEHDFGIVARVAVSREELETCKKRLDARRGGASSAVETRGGFVVLDGVSAGGVKGRLAYGNDDLLIVSTGAWFDAIVATANGEQPSLREAKEHASLRASLTGREGWKSPTLLATAILPRALRDRIRGEMRGEAEGSASSTAAMVGVLGVSAVGLAVKAGPTGGRVEAHVEMICDDADACGAVETLIQKKRLEWSKDFALRMVGFGPAIDSLETKRTGPRLDVVASANADLLAQTLERVTKLRAKRDGSDDAPPGKPPPLAAPRAPDETLAAPDGG